MFRSFCMTALVGMTPGVLLAQQCAPKCDAPYPCRTCTPKDNAAPADTPGPGNYLRGPGTGQAAGESRSFGIRGPALHIPEMRIALPTIEFPSPVRFKRGAEMIFDQVRGPHSFAAVQDYGNLPEDDNAAPADSKDDNPAPVPPAPYYCPPACDPSIYGATTQRLEATLARMEAMERELEVLRAAAAEKESRSANVAPNPAGAAKPVGVSAAATGSHPVAKKPSQFYQAGYEEPAPAPARQAATTRPRAGNIGLSVPTASTKRVEPDQFGTWSRASRGK